MDQPWVCTCRAISVSEYYQFLVIFFLRRLNARPTFFGCNASDVTNHDASHTAPVIGQYAADSSRRRRQCLLMSLEFYDLAYIPAYPWSTFANTSEDKLQYSSHESRAALDNGVHSATLNNTVCYAWCDLSSLSSIIVYITFGSQVSNWPACLACAAVKRSVERSGRSHSAQCTQCYNTWCWNGATNNTQPATWAPQLGKLPKFVADLNGHSCESPPFINFGKSGLKEFGVAYLQQIPTRQEGALWVMESPGRRQ